MLSAITIVFVVAAPPISQAADYWGRRWLLIGLCLIAFVGAIITSRATSVRLHLYIGRDDILLTLNLDGDGHCWRSHCWFILCFHGGSKRRVSNLLICVLIFSFYQPLTFAVASEVLPHRHRLAGQAAINAVSSPFAELLPISGLEGATDGRIRRSLLAIAGRRSYEG